ncbi:MAG: acyl-CoA thioesterase [Actinomycetota bacterium]
MNAPFVHCLRVRYAEIDRQNVVFNAHWLTYFDEACCRFMESLGLGDGFWARDFDVMPVKAVLEWSGPARFNDRVDVQVTPCRLGRTSFELRYEATVTGIPACSATITYVAITPGTNESVELPAAVRAALNDRTR